MADPRERSHGPKKQNQSNAYLKYSSLGLQLLLAIGIAGWLGYKLDQWLDIRFPAFMLLFGLCAFGGTIYQIYKSINQE